MKIIKNLMNLINRDLRVEECIIGSFNTVIKNSVKSSIVSTVNYNKQNDTFHSLEKNIINKSCFNVAEMALSENTVEASVGFAAMNSALPENHTSVKTLNAKNIIYEMGQDKKVGIIGHFPFIDNFDDNFKKLMVFEKFPGIDDFHENDIPELLPEADLVAITATTLINKSFDNIMSHIRKNAFVIILGPSTPLHHSLFQHRINVISGSQVLYPEKVIKQVKNKVPFRKLDGIKYITMYKEIS